MGLSMVLVKIWQFIHVFILRKIVKGNVFQGSLKRKKRFFRLQKSKLKMSKNWHISKGVSHRFGQKLTIFHVIILGKRGQGNLFHDILERNNDFLDYKNNNLKTGINWDFCKGVSPWFLSKFGNLSIFLFKGK